MCSCLLCWTSWRKLIWLERRVLNCKSLHYLITLIVVSFRCFAELTWRMRKNKAAIPQRKMCWQSRTWVHCLSTPNLIIFEETWFLHCYCVNWIIAFVNKENLEFTIKDVKLPTLNFCERFISEVHLAPFQLYSTQKCTSQAKAYSIDFYAGKSK